MEKKLKLFCFGFGQVAEYFVNNLIKSNFNFELNCTNTLKTEQKKIKNIKYKSYYFADEKFDDNLLSDLNSSNKILISIPPKNNTDIVLKIFDKSFRKNKFDWITYLSSTSVYGDKKGDWVDEKTKTNPSSDIGVARLNAENSWLKLFNKFNLPVQIFRLSGIYSIKNNIIRRLLKKNLKIINKENQFFSRIHVEDIAEILKISLKKFTPGEIYNITDDYPCSNYELAEYASKLMNMDIPEKISLESVDSRMLKKFYKDSKRVSNKKMKIFFDYHLKYQTYKEGLDKIKKHII